MAELTIPVKGTQFLFTTQTTHLADSPAALPTSFPASAKNLVDGTVGVPANEWVNFKCVMDVGSLGAVTPETKEHRCINDPNRIAKKLATGYDTVETVELQMPFYQEEYAFFKTLAAAYGQIRFLYVLKTRSDHDKPGRGAAIFQITGVSQTFGTGGDPVGMTLKMEQATDWVFVAGTEP
jgi:hypothetical protein